MSSLITNILIDNIVVLYLYVLLHIQWNPSITDTLGTQNFVRYNEVSLSQGLPVYFR